MMQALTYLDVNYQSLDGLSPGKAFLLAHRNMTVLHASDWLTGAATPVELQVLQTENEERDSYDYRLNHF